MKKQTLIFLTLGTLLIGSLTPINSLAQLAGCIVRSGEKCEPPRYGRSPQPGYGPAQPYPGRPPHPNRPSHSFEIRIPVNHWVYGYQRLDLNRIIDLRRYQGFRILEVTVLARTVNDFEGHLELLLNGNRDSSQRVVYRDPFHYRLPAWGYRTMGRDVRWLEIGAQDAHLLEIAIRLSQD